MPNSTAKCQRRRCRVKLYGWRERSRRRFGTIRRRTARRRTARRRTARRPVRQHTHKYRSRPSPPFPANEHCGENKRGNDMMMYRSVPNMRGICRWTVV